MPESMASASSVAADQVLAHPSVGPVLEQVVAEGVEAAALGDPGGGTIDVAAILLPASGQITTGLNEAGVPVTNEQVEAALARLDPLVVRDPTHQPLVGAISPLAANLGMAACSGRCSCFSQELRTSSCRWIGCERSGRCSPASPSGRFRSLCCCESGLGLSIRRAEGRRSVRVSRSWKLEMDGAPDHRPRRDGCGDRVPRLSPAGQTGGSVPLRIRAAHTPRSMTPVPTRMVFSHLVGRGSTRPEPRAETTPIRRLTRRRSTAPGVVADGGAEVAPYQGDAARVMPQPGQAMP